MPLPTPLPITPLLPWFDMAGLAVFAASGALAAARARQTIVTAAFFAIVTGLGGGTLRDLLIGAPVFWMLGSQPVAICLGVAGMIWLSPRAWWPSARSIGSMRSGSPPMRSMARARRWRSASRRCPPR